MDWKVVVPSYNRPEGFKEKTLATLKYHNISPSHIYLFVANEEQKEVYERVLTKGDVGHIIVAEKGLPQVRNFIFKYFPKGTPLVSFDDDVRGFVRLDGEKLRPLRVPEFKQLVDMAFAECKRVGANFWGDYPVPNGFYMENSISYDLKFIMGSFWGCFNPGTDVQITIGNGEKEDYMRTIQFWERDGKVVRMNFWAHKTATYNEAGGLQSDGVKARQEREQRTVNEMLKKWPQYVRRNPRRKGPFPEILFIRQPFDGERKRLLGVGRSTKTRSVARPSSHKSQTRKYK
jgi:hypothetical protein